MLYLPPSNFPLPLTSCLREMGAWYLGLHEERLALAQLEIVAIEVAKLTPPPCRKMLVSVSVAHVIIVSMRTYSVSTHRDHFLVRRRMFSTSHSNAAFSFLLLHPFAPPFSFPPLRPSLRSAPPVQGFFSPIPLAMFLRASSLHPLFLPPP